MAVNLSPVGGVAAQFLDNNGNVLSGGKLYTYSAGTTTPAATFTSSLGITAHTNPIVLDAAGRVPSGEIWLTDGVIYKFVLKTSADVLIATYDNITGINSNFVNFTAQQEIQTATAGQTVFDLTTMQYQPGTNSLTVYVDGVNQYGPGSSYAYLETDSDTVTFVSGLHEGAEVKFTTAVPATGTATNADVVTYEPPFTGAVATTVEAKLAQTVSVKDFGAVGDGVTDDTAAIQAAIDSINPYEYQVSSISQTPFSAVVLLPRGTYKVSTIELRNGVILRGEGGTNLKTTSNAPVIRQAANTYTNPLNPLQTHSAYGIELLTIYGSNDPQTGARPLQDGIYLGYDDRYNSASHSFIKDVVITSMEGNGIKLHKPAVANDQWGWTQFGKWSNVLITSCAGYGFIASGVTGKADFSSMLLEQFFVGACYAGGISISGGNDNRIQGTSASIGFTRGLTNLSADDSVVLNDLLFTDLDIHIESPANQSSYGVNIGKTALCYATSIRGLFDGADNPIKITASNGCKLDNLMFQDVPVGNYCILNYGRYTEIGKNWYQNTTGALFLNDQVATPATYAATGYITPNALTFGPTNLYTSSNDYPNNISANGVAIGLGGSTSSTKVGKDALKVATGAQNTALGFQAGLTISTGANNTAVGTNALIGVTTASNATAIGQNALLSATGAQNTALGASAGLNVTTGTNNVLLGYIAGTDAVLNVTTQSNQVVIGNNSTTNATIKVAWTVTSDKRDKSNFSQVPHGLAFVNNLKPVSYQFKVSRETDEVSGPRRYGFLAQDILEVEGADPVIVNAEDSEHLKYTESYLIPVLVNAIQELSKRVDDLQKGKAA